MRQSTTCRYASFFSFFFFSPFFFIFLPYVALRQVLICFYDSRGKQHLVSSSWLIDSFSLSLLSLYICIYFYYFVINFNTKWYQRRIYEIFSGYYYLELYYTNIFNVSVLIYSMKRFWIQGIKTNVKVNIWKWLAN